MIKTIFTELNEVSKNSVSIEWFVKTNSSWYGEFIVNEKTYHINFEVKSKFGCKYGTMKFGRNDLNDPYSLVGDNNKPLVIKSTVLEALNEFLSTIEIDAFIIKRNKGEKTMVEKYIKYLDMVKYKFGFIQLFEEKIGNYHYILITKHKCIPILMDTEKMKKEVQSLID